MVYLSSLKWNIAIDSDRIINLKYILRGEPLIKVLIPNIKIKNEVESVDFYIIHKHAKHPSIKRQGRSFIFRDDWKDNNIPGYVFFFLYKLFDFLYQKDGLLALHASAVACDNIVYIFAGNPGSGKTSLAINLASRDGYSFISNNRTVIKIDSSSAYCVAGTPEISIRSHDKTKNLRARFISKNNLNIYNPKDININFEKNPHKYKIGAIFFIQINPGVKEAFLINKEESIYKIYSNISQTILGEALLFYGTQPSPIFDSHNLQLTRIKRINAMLEFIPIIHLSGSMEFILNKINQFEINGSKF